MQFRITCYVCYGDTGEHHFLYFSTSPVLAPIAIFQSRKGGNGIELCKQNYTYSINFTVWIIIFVKSKLPLFTFLIPSNPLFLAYLLPAFSLTDQLAKCTAFSFILPYLQNNARNHLLPHGKVLRLHFLMRMHIFHVCPAGTWDKFLWKAGTICLQGMGMDGFPRNYSYKRSKVWWDFGAVHNLITAAHCWVADLGCRK